MFGNIRYEGELYRKSNQRAGYDIVNHKDVLIPAGQTVMIETNVRFPNGTRDNFALVTLRSSYQSSGLIMPATGILDSNYYDYLFVTVFNSSGHTIKLYEGDRFCQIVFIKNNDTILEEIKNKWN